MSGSRAIRTGWGIPWAGLCFAAVLLCLPAVAKAASWNGGAAQAEAGVSLALPGTPDLRVAEKREAVLRRTLGCSTTTSQAAQSLADSDGPLALLSGTPDIAPADARATAAAEPGLHLRRHAPAGGFHSRAPPARI